jgi:hypothetical protein
MTRLDHVLMEKRPAENLEFWGVILDPVLAKERTQIQSDPVPGRSVDTLSAFDHTRDNYSICNMEVHYLSLLGAIPISLCNGKSLHLSLISAQCPVRSGDPATRPTLRG